MKTNRLRWLAATACSLSLVAGGVALLMPTTPVHAEDMQMDKPDKDIIETATGPGMDNVTTLVEAVKAADLVDTLKGPGPFTVFAPTNEAFKKVPSTEMDFLMKPAGKEKLVKLLKYHVVSGSYDEKQLMGMTELPTLDEGKTIKLKTMDDKLMVNDATVTKPDIKCSNGMIQQIDTVLDPG